MKWGEAKVTKEGRGRTVMKGLVGGPSALAPSPGGPHRARQGHSPSGPLGRRPPEGPLPQHTIELHFGADVQRVRVSLLQRRRGRHRVGLGREHPASAGPPQPGPPAPRGRHGRGAPGEGGRGGRLRGGGVGGRLRASSGRVAAGGDAGRPRQRTAALKRAGPGAPRQLARGAQPAARAAGCAVPGGNSAGREAQPPASSIAHPPP